MAATDPWTRSGFVRGQGIPAPSGERSVGCVDLMHQFEGDEAGGLLVRLFYPAQLNQSQPRALPTTYAPWVPNKMYTKAYLAFKNVRGSGFVSSITNAFLNPRIPAVLGAALLGSYFQPSPAATSETNDIDSTPGSETGVNAESGEGSGRVNGPGSPLFPVIVFSHGLGAMRTTYSGICCDLASHGYVVASVEHRDRSACGSLQRVPSSTANTFQDQLIEFYHRPETEAEFPLRNKQVLQRSRDGILALELLTMLNEGVEVHNMMEGHFDFGQFQGRLDLRKAAIMGHSFGGATTIQALSQDHRFMCGIALDCWMVPVHRDLLETGVQQPLLFINSFTFQWPDSVRKMMKLTRPPQHTGASACTILTLQGTSHTNQSDMPFVIPKLARRFTNMESALDPVLAHGLNMDICHAFFKRYLLRDPAYCEKSVPNLDGCEGHSDHIIFGSNVDVSIPSEDGATHLATGQAGGNKEGTEQGDVAGGANEPAKSGEIVEMAEEKAQTETETLDSEHAAKL